MYKEINLPQNIRFNKQSFVKIVRIDGFKNIKEFKNYIDKTLEFYSKNTNKIYFHLKDLNILKTLDNLMYRNLNISFDVNIKNIEFLKTHKSLLKNHSLKASLDSTIKTKELVDVVKFLAKKQIKSEISYDLFKKLDEDDFKNITNKLILDKSFTKSSDPFFGFVNHIYEKKAKKNSSLTLWELFKDKEGEFYYINQNGDTTISKRWDKRGKYLFNIDDSVEQKESSELLKSLKSYDENLFFENLDCAMCDRYEFCKAYLRFENSTYDCSGFKSMLEMIEENFDIFKTNLQKKMETV